MTFPLTHLGSMHADAVALTDRRARLALAIKLEARWQILARPADHCPSDAATYRKMRNMLITAMRKARARQIDFDVLHGVNFYNAVEAYGKLFAAVHAYRRERFHERRGS